MRRPVAVYYYARAGRRVLVDAKFGFSGGFYDVTAALGSPRFIKNSDFIKAIQLRKTVDHQSAAARNVGAHRVEWFVPDMTLASKLNSAFREMGVAGQFYARYLPNAD